MIVLVYIIASVVLVSLMSLIGAVTLSVRRETLQEILLILVAFAAGSMLGAAFSDLIPESAENIGEQAFPMVLAGILLFFVVERFIHWHHCNKEECHTHPMAHLNLIGDGVHNFIDGVIIAASFLTNTKIGFITTLAILLHEIPQEMGDFAVLLHAGLERKKALAYNFISALLAVLGAVLGYFFLDSMSDVIPYIVAVAGGGFVYIATADLMPELHKERHRGKLVLQTISVFLGIIVVYYIVGLFPHAH